MRSLLGVLVSLFALMGLSASLAPAMAEDTFANTRWAMQQTINGVSRTGDLVLQADNTATFTFAVNGQQVELTGVWGSSAEGEIKMTLAHSTDYVGKRTPEGLAGEAEYSPKNSKGSWTAKPIQ